MPALITHDTFGRDAYGQLFEFIGGTKEESEAFLLGNQGPDPLFYTLASPRLMSANRVGSMMHKERPSELLSAMKRSIEVLPQRDQSIGRAYAMGFVCHYLLDSTAHPLIYNQEYALCDAGVDGLDRSNHIDVHALIESDLDVMVLTTKRHTTIAAFDPSKRILKASDHVLDVIAKMYVSVLSDVYDIAVPDDTFRTAVKLMRLVQSFFYSPNGFKSNVIGRLEMLMRPYSFFRAMSHRNRQLFECDFDNHEHARWTSPFTGAVSTLSFNDLYSVALNRVDQALRLFDDAGFDDEMARSITHDLNFSGDCTVATIISVEDAGDLDIDDFEFDELDVEAPRDADDGSPGDPLADGAAGYPGDQGAQGVDPEHPEAAPDSSPDATAADADTDRDHA